MKYALLLLALAACTDDAKFPEDYAATYTEVRDCRSSSDHDLRRIRILADPAALAPYRDRTGFPVGAVVLKEEYDFSDLDCEGEVVEWTVMVKTAGSARLGWDWQRIAADRSLVNENNSTCSNCHSSCGVPPDGFDGTCAVP